MNEKTRKRSGNSLMQRFMGGLIEYALRGIERIEDDWPPSLYLEDGPPPKIECLIHRVVLTGPYKYPELRTALGPLKQDDGPIRRAYKENYFSNISGFRRSVYVKPTTFRRQCCIEVVPSREVEPKEYKRMLMGLVNGLPYLQVSEVEYAVDVYCRSHQREAFLFDELLRYFWGPHKRRIRLSGAKVEDWERDDRMNRLFYLEKNALKLKVYERGPDKSKRGKGWPWISTDRLRFEQTVKLAKLKELDIVRLYDFIQNVRFEELSKDAFKFRRFKPSYPRKRSPKKPLPMPWDPYPWKDSKGQIPGAFHAGYLYYNKLTAGDPDYRENILQYVQDTPEFAVFKRMLIEATRDFDREWEMA